MRAFPVLPPRPGPLALAGPVLLVLVLAACTPEQGPGEILDSPCDLGAGPCTVALGGDRVVTLAITPRPIPLMAPLAIQARVQGAAAPTVTLDFVGEDMDMGLNRRTLAPGPEAMLTGVASLPVCVTGAMTWRAELTLKWPDGPQAVRFRFQTR